MKIYYYLGFLIPLILSTCYNHHSTVYEMKCDQEYAKQITDNLIQKTSNLKVKDMDVQIIEDSLFFKIIYSPKNNLYLGGGAKFKLLKSTCKIVESKYYQ